MLYPVAPRGRDDAGMTAPEVLCPACRAPFAPGAAACPACGIRLVGPDAVRLWQVDQQITALRAEAAGLLESMRAPLPAGSVGASAAAHGAALARLHRQRADLAAVLNRLADAARSPEFDVTTHIADNMAALAIPEASLDAIASALIENSRQAGATRIAFIALSTGKTVTIRAEDNGPGIPAADRERIFEPFFTTRRTTGGSGLGLPIIRSLVESAGGSLHLEASEQGAVFVIELPVPERT